MSEAAKSISNAEAEVGESAALWRALAAIADKEAAFTERFYALFFLRRPDTRELFGANPLAEQEEMMRETLRSLAALSPAPLSTTGLSRHGLTPRGLTPPGQGDQEAEQAPWLAENLRALGVSHAEYGVTGDMYESFRAVMIESAREMFGKQLDEDAYEALDQALIGVCRMMNPDD